MDEELKRQNSIFTSVTLASTRVAKPQKNKLYLKKSTQNLLRSQANLYKKQKTLSKQKNQISQDVLNNKKYISRRYNTVEGEINRIKSKRTSTTTFSNQIYFPHNIKQVQKDKQIYVKNKGFNFISSQGLKRQRQVKSHQKSRKYLLNQIQQNNQNLTYLAKLNQQKEIKIKQIYMPKGLNSFHIDAKKQFNKIIPKSKSHTQAKNSKLFAFFQVKNKAQKQQNTNSFNSIIIKQKNPFQKQKTQQHEKFSKSLNLKKNTIKTELEDSEKPIKNQIQFKKIKRLQINESIFKKQSNNNQKLPRYTEFYDSFLTQVQIDPTKSSNSRKYQRSEKYQSHLNQSLKHKIVTAHVPTPIITEVKHFSKTPHLQPSPNGHIYIPDMVQKQWVREKFNPHLELLKNISDLSDFIIKKINEGVYFGQIYGQKMHGLGVIFNQNGVLFEGNFVNNQKCGQGYQLYPDGSFFLGNYQDNKKNGKGRFQWNNGQIYDGQWKNGKKHGSGLWKANQISYVGEWKHNSIQGFGVLIQQNQRYEGQFYKFAKNGHGTYRYSNGQVYNGSFKLNRLNGQGEYYWPNGDYYKGEFVNNKRHGSGTLKLAEGVSYNGQFRNDKKCGLGEQTYENSLSYIGNFENDLKHGWGTLSTKDTPIYSGYWVNNRTLQVSQTPSNNSVIDQQEQFLRNNMSDKILNTIPQPELQNLNKINLLKKAQNQQKQIQKLRHKHLKNNYYIKRIVQTKHRLSKQKSSNSQDSNFKRAFKRLPHK